MGELLSYAIVNGLVMLAMYLVYRVFISRDNQHGFNRAVLLSIYLVSLCAWPTYNHIGSLREPAPQPTIELGDLPPYVFELTNTAVMQPAEPERPVWGTILIWIYIAGAAVVSVRTMLTWGRIVRLIRSGRRIPLEGYTLVVTDDDRTAPFSWMRYVVIGRQDYESGNQAIITHELGHLRLMHWIDLLVAQAVCVLEWFNPAAWLMRDELMLVHEYQADMSVIDSGCDIHDYQMLLVKKALGDRFPSLVNSMNHSNLKKRITMMYRTKSGAGCRLKTLALIPVAALALALVSVPAVKAAVATIGDSGISLDARSFQTQNPAEQAEPRRPLIPESEKDIKDNVESPDTTLETVTARTVKAPEAAAPTEAREATETPIFIVSHLVDDGETTALTVHGRNVSDNVRITDAVLINRGVTYKAVSQKVGAGYGAVSVTSVFPTSGGFENASLTMTVDGVEVKIGLTGYRVPDGWQYSTSYKRHNDVPEAKASGPSDKKEILSLLSIPKEGEKIYKEIYYTIPDSGIKVYLDGNRVGEDEMKALDPKTIAEIRVSKEDGRIDITTGKD